MGFEGVIDEESYVEAFCVMYVAYKDPPVVPAARE